MAATMVGCMTVPMSGGNMGSGGILGSAHVVVLGGPGMGAGRIGLRLAATGLGRYLRMLRAPVCRGSAVAMTRGQGLHGCKQDCNHDDY